MFLSTVLEYGRRTQEHLLQDYLVPISISNKSSLHALKDLHKKRGKWKEAVQTLRGAHLSTEEAIKGDISSGILLEYLLCISFFLFPVTALAPARPLPLPSARLPTSYLHPRSR